MDNNNNSAVQFAEEEATAADYFDNNNTTTTSCGSPSKSSTGLKLVPWLSWDEWDNVRTNLFSSSSDAVSSALKRISAWQSRGCVPVEVEVTAAIVDIQQKDPYFRKDLCADGVLSAEMLAMLYCMAIMRLVNGVVEKTRRKREVSIGAAADALDIPRMLIDIRHEGSHRDLPALTVVRTGSIKALNWLKNYYWECQKNMIPFRSNESANIRKEIKSILRRLAKQRSQSGSSVLKKCGRRNELLWGHSKLLAMTGKFAPSKSGDSKKQMKKTLNNLVRLYSSFSSEVASVLLDFLLKALNSVENPENSDIGSTIHNLFGDWKFVITRVSNKEPDLLLTLLKAVLDMIDSNESLSYETGDLSCNKYPTEHLCFLFAWLSDILKQIKPFRHNKPGAEGKVSSVEINYSKSILMEIVRKCLTSSPGNPQLMNSALHIGKLMGDSSLGKKLQKISCLNLSSIDVDEENSHSIDSTHFYLQLEESLHLAAEKLELIRSQRTKNRFGTTRNDVKTSNRWNVVKSWNPCPIGMLPRSLGSSGCRPVLDCPDNSSKVSEVMKRNESWELNRCSRKREATPDMHLLDNTIVKKVRETVESQDAEGPLCVEGVQGHLLENRIYKKVGEEERLAILSGIYRYRETTNQYK